VWRVETKFTETAAPFFAPAIPLLQQDEELQAIRQFVNSSYFDSLATSPATRPRLADITPRWGISRATGPVSKGAGWAITVLVSAGTTMVLFAAYHVLQFLWPWARLYCQSRAFASNPGRPGEGDTSQELSTISISTVEPGTEGTGNPTPKTRYRNQCGYGNSSE
jgi:hypothetical protein